MDREHHSHLVAGLRHHFWTDRLWALSGELPVHEILIAEIAEFDQDCWFHGRAPTCREVAVHTRRIQAADLKFPVILGSDGALMDGGHRIAKAWLSGQPTIRAVRFLVDPSPDWVTDDQGKSATRSKETSCDECPRAGISSSLTRGGY